jgi:predicted nuclease of restriction endonuclease-like (RecB) superfamily
MNEKQRELAFGLMQASLSAKGLKKSQDIMKLNGTLAELAGNFDEYGEWLYWITIMGEPSATDPWGWQIDGHHLIINYFVLGDQVVMSPVFVGSEPVHATSGRFKGAIVMQDEQDKGLMLIRTLTAGQQEQAVLSVLKDGNNALAQAYKDNLDLDYAGLPASKLDEKQKALLMEVIEEFVGNMDDGHAKIKMNEVKQHLDRTYFAWVGGKSDDSVFYYRIHSPVVLIEFDHQRRVAPFRSRQPSRDHIHAVLRTPNGNDYGKDLLRQHYELHHNGDKHSH